MSNTNTFSHKIPFCPPLQATYHADPQRNETFAPAKVAVATFVSLQMSIWPYLFSLPMTFVRQKLSHIFLSSPQGFWRRKTEEWVVGEITPPPQKPLVGAKMLGIFKGTMTTSQIELELTFVIAGTTI